MKLVYAKFWLRKFIKYNVSKLNERAFNSRLNRAVICLSHRVFKSHGFHGHSTRQEIRQQLQEFVGTELQKYGKKWTIRSPNHGYLKSVEMSIFSRIIYYLKGLVTIRRGREDEHNQ